MALSKDNLQAIIANTLAQQDRSNRYDGFIDLLRLLSLGELDSVCHIINDPRNPASKTFDAFGTFLDPVELPPTFTLPAKPKLQSTLPSFDTIPRTTAIRITLVSLRYDYADLAKSKDRDLYLYKISDEYMGLLMNRLPQANAPVAPAFRKNAADRRRQIKDVQNLIAQLLIDINQFELKTVSQMIVTEILNSMAKEESIVAELIGALLAFGFEKVLDAVVKTVAGFVKRGAMSTLTAPDGLFVKLFMNSGPSVVFDGNAVYEFLSKDETFFESGMRKTLHTITSKAFADPEKAMHAPESAQQQKEIQQADELRNLLIDYVTMLEHSLQAISGRLDVVFKEGEIDISSTNKGYDLLSDDDLDAIYMFVFGYDYQGVITKFIDDYNANLKDIGLVNSDAPGILTAGFKDYRVATWLVWKSNAYLVLADVPFSRAALDVRVYNAIPKTIKAAALKKTEVAIAAYSDFGGRWPLLYASSPPLIPLDSAYAINAGELRSMYDNPATRDRVQYPAQKSGSEAAH